MKRVIVFYRLAREELDKIIFPVRSQIISAFLSVFIVVLVITLFLYLSDLIISAIINGML